MIRILCIFPLLGLMSQSLLSAEPKTDNASLQIMSIPVECSIQLPSRSKDWIKKTTEMQTIKDLPAGTYEVLCKSAGRTLRETVTLKAGQTQVVNFNFLVRDLSEVPAVSPAQEALVQLTQAKLYHVENRMADAWTAIQQAKTLYSDDPEILDVYSEINTQRNQQINTLWISLQQARRDKNRAQMLASLSQIYKLSPNHPGARQVSQEEGVTFNTVGMMMLRVKAGRFAMGAQQSVEAIDKLGGRNSSHHARETPLHSVRFSRDFLMSAHPVTRGQFRAFIESTGYITDAQRGKLTFGVTDRGLGRKRDMTWDKLDFEQQDDHPVVCVTWNDALAFCQWLSKQDSRVYLLPTEAQWEYAAKAGTTSLFWWGDDFDRKNLPANISDQSLVQWRADNFPRKQRKARWDDSFAFTSPVGHYPANPWGFYDMLGNVSEWCRDWQGSYVAQQLTDPQGPAQGKNRVVRGGSWNAYPAFCRSSYRGSMRPDRASTAIGFRVVSEIK